MCLGLRHTTPGPWPPSLSLLFLIFLLCGYLAEPFSVLQQYVYSAWAPQFADKLHLTTTESNLIGLAGNLGMYSMGVPIGLFVDHRGPRPAVIAGSLLLAFGYFPISAAFETGSGSVPVLCIFSFLTGLGGCMAFNAAVKTSALNWPHHRGTATAFPLAAFGLSAFFFSLLGGLLFPANTSAFLSLLAIGTFFMTFAGYFFLKVYPHTSYHSLSAGDPTSTGSQRLHRTPSSDRAKAARHPGHSHYRSLGSEPGRSPTSYTTPLADESAGAVEGAQPLQESVCAGSSKDTGPVPRTLDETDVEVVLPIQSSDTAFHEVDETSSLMSKSSSPSSSLAGDVLVQNSVDLDRSHRIDIRGLRLLRNLDFWQLFTILGVLAGIGLMTIK